MRYDNNAGGIKYPNLGSYNYDPCAISFFLLVWISFIMSMHKIDMCMIDRNKCSIITVLLKVALEKHDGINRIIVLKDIW